MSQSLPSRAGLSPEAGRLSPSHQHPLVHAAGPGCVLCLSLGLLPPSPAGLADVLIAMSSSPRFLAVLVHVLFVASFSRPFN